MKKAKIFIAGTLTGLLLAAAVTVSAAGVKQQVTAYRSDSVVFTVDGEVQTLPSDMTAIFYQDRVYTPARFIAESLGATVTWDDPNETVVIKSPPTSMPVVTPEPTQTATPEPTEKAGTTYGDGYFYQTLPLKLGKSGVILNIYSGSLSSDGELYIGFEITNDSQFIDFLYVLRDSYVVVDGKEYEPSYSMENEYTKTVSPYDSEEDYVYYAGLPSKAKKVKLVFPARTQESGSSVTRDVEYVFYIDISN